MKRKPYPLSAWLLALACALFFISFSVVAVLHFRPLYYFDIKALGVEETSGLPEEEIRANYDALIDYNSLSWHGCLQFPTLPMSEGGRIHFEDVRTIFVFVQYLCIVSFLAAAVGGFFRLRKRDGAFLKLAGILTPAIPAILGVLIACSWDSFFVMFHKLLFRNDYWLFDPETDPVITILPDAFFLHCAAAILLLVLLLCGASFLAGTLISPRRSPQPCSPDFLPHKKG